MPTQVTTKIRTKRRLASLPPALRPVWPYAKRAHTMFVGAVAPASIAVSRLIGGQLPHRTVRTVEEAVALGEAWLCVAREPQRLTRAVPDGVPPRHPTFVAQADEVVPRVAVAALPEGRVLGPYRAVLTGAGTLIGELSPYFGTSRPGQNPVFTDLFVPPPTIVSGRIGVLAARGDVSYYHYLTDVLPRLAILESLPEPPDRYYLPASLPFQQELIELLEIPRERVIDSNQVRHLQAETLIVPGLPDPDLKTPPWIVRFLRERLTAAGADPLAVRRLYLSRGTVRGSRTVRNEAAVVAALSARGFAVVDPGRMPVREQIATFAQAECVVAPHGAALTNLAFLQPGASVIEMFAPDYVQGCYWKICDCLPGVSYRYHVGAGRPRRGHRMDGVDSDMTIDVGDLLSQLDAGAPAEHTAHH